LLSAIKLGQGLYNLTMAVVNQADHVQAGGGIGTFVPVAPVLTALETLPAQGPQPMVATNETLIGTAGGTGQYWTGAFGDFLLSIPRGGAWLQSGLAYTLASFATLVGPTFTMNLRRLKGYEDISGLHIGKPGVVLAVGWAQCSGREPPVWDGRPPPSEARKALFATSPRALKWIGQAFVSSSRLAVYASSAEARVFATRPVFAPGELVGVCNKEVQEKIDRGNDVLLAKEKKRAQKRKELLDLFRDMRMQIVDQLRDEMSQTSDVELDPSVPLSRELDPLMPRSRVLPSLTTA